MNARLFRNSLLAPVVLLAMVGAVACSAGGGKRVDSGPADLVLDFMFGEAPPGCPPAQANNRGIGAPCTRNGNECGGMHCTCKPILSVEPPTDTPCFCTEIRFRTCEQLAVEEPGVCGQNATCCGYMNVGSLCVPDVCLGGMMCPVL